jgi:hypothetical protein
VTIARSTWQIAERLLLSPGWLGTVTHQTREERGPWKKNNLCLKRAIRLLMVAEAGYDDIAKTIDQQAIAQSLSRVEKDIFAKI